MATIFEIIGGSIKDPRHIRYEHFLFSYGTPDFLDKLNEMTLYYKVSFAEFIRDDLWRHGIISDRGMHRISSGVRGKIKDYLEKFPMPINEEPVKNQKMKDRQIAGLETLKQYGESHGFYIIGYIEESGLVMWDVRKRGILVNSGSSWAYVYKTGLCFENDKHFPLLGFFQLGGNDVTGKLEEAIIGGMKERTDALSQRRKAFVMRQKSGWSKYNAKKKAAELR